MKANLLELESRFPPSLVEDAMALTRDSREYSIHHVEGKHYQVLGDQPALQVDIQLMQKDGAKAICYCPAYRRQKKCKHALAGLFLLRDHLAHQKPEKKRVATKDESIETALRKLPARALKNLVTDYARTHGSFKAELLAQTLHLTRSPDYAKLLSDLVPVDKFGKIKITRSQFKTIRRIHAILISQAKKLLQEGSLTMTFRILEPLILHLQLLIARCPNYETPLLTDLKSAVSLMEKLCARTTAPTLQLDLVRFAIMYTDRASSSFPSILHLVETFVLDKKDRKVYYDLVQRMSIQDGPHQLYWQELLVRCMRLWGLKTLSDTSREKLEKHLPQLMIHLFGKQTHEDVLFVYPLFEKNNSDPEQHESCLRATWKSARQLNNEKLALQLSIQLSGLYLDTECLLWLVSAYPDDAMAVMRAVETTYPDPDPAADNFLLAGWKSLQDVDRLRNRLFLKDDPETMVAFDQELGQESIPELIPFYARHIRMIRDQYGGMLARQKLHSIFEHLKTTDLYGAVMDEIKQENQMAKSTSTSNTIGGFVFDLDGVIVDTAVHHFNGWRRLLRELGTEIADEDDHHTRGASRMESLEYLLQKYNLSFSDSEKEALAARKNEYYLQSIETITPDDLLPGALTFLDESQNLGLKIALGSASKNARTVLAKLGIEDYFDAIMDGHSAKASKPDPEIFIKACEALQLPGEKVVVFEDAAKGVQAAIAAGCHVVGIGESSTLPGADIVISGLDAMTPTAIIEQLT